jgi:CheY-like chemotaxis protein
MPYIWRIRHIFCSKSPRNRSFIGWRALRISTHVAKIFGDKIPLLIVEPDPLSARLLQVTLADENYDIDVATTGREALSKIVARPPALLLLELTLPDMNGVDLITTLKAAASTRGIVVIVVTSRNGHATEAEVLRSGAAAYVRKPIDPLAFPTLLGPKPAP